MKKVVDGVQDKKQTAFLNLGDAFSGANRCLLQGQKVPSLGARDAFFRGKRCLLCGLCNRCNSRLEVLTADTAGFFAGFAPAGEVVVHEGVEACGVAGL